MKTKPVRIVATLSLVVVLFPFTVHPVAATHELVDCGDPDEFEPLVLLIHDVTMLMIYAGAALAVLSLAYAGIVILIGSRDQIAAAKRRVKLALAGTVILFSAPLLIAFIASRLPGCGGV